MSVNPADQKIAVFGGGIMGRGICQAFLMGGYKVHLCSRTSRTILSAEAHIRASLENLQIYGLLKDAKDAMSRLTTGTDKAEALDGAMMLMEVISENLELKKSFFAECEKYADPEAIFASNTSHLDPEAIFADLDTKHRCLIAHWFNPAQLMPLVEVAKLSYTDPVYWEKTVAMLKDAGKVAVKIKRPIQGLLINRLFTALIREACYLNDLGIADVEEIDEAIKASIGIRNFCIGVFKTIDLGGLIDWHACLELLLPLMDNTARPPASMTKMVYEGFDGIKMGEGYYKYDVAFNSTDMDAELLARDDMLMRLLKLQGKQW
ncbi:3-hydroxyacyl-CoA dehydrogenase family protein [Deltaproteobacteria bacterium OttesenSCG-928-M10]|nr:3-hydroxyacyl-CoA dehydrogenase family protein [Deltaproteobacteria bacterium OttesenSCG-928-M10]